MIREGRFRVDDLVPVAGSVLMRCPSCDREETVTDARAPRHCGGWMLPVNGRLEEAS